MVAYFDDKRNKRGDVYPSEWFFLKDRLREGMSVLDIGCAQGGFSSILSETLTDFSYTGVDISPDMIEAAKQRHPQHEFHCVSEQDYSLLQSRVFDIVLVLGILHLHESWRETVATAWKHAAGALLLDLRETEHVSIEDKAHSYFDTFGEDNKSASQRLPYNLINSSEAIVELRNACPHYDKIEWYGYEHPASEHASVPVETILMNVYCINR